MLKLHRLILIAILICVSSISVFCQKSDTVFYPNGLIRSITIQIGGNEDLITLNDISGQDLLYKGDFTYEYFDSVMNMPCYLDIKNKSIYREYWINESDTIYNNANFDDGFLKTIKAYHRYVTSSVKYPKEARQSRIQGKVMIGFIVDKKGEIYDIKPLSDIGYGLEETATDIIKNRLDFGKIYLEGRPVSCYFRLPVYFILR